jgi:hypothetical protein
MTAKVSLGLDVSLIDTAPGGAEKQVCDVPRIQPLPLGNFSGRLVLL